MRTSSYQDKRIGNYLTSEFADAILNGNIQTISGDMSGLMDIIADIVDADELYPRKVFEEWAEQNGYITPEECETCDGDESN